MNNWRNEGEQKLAKLIEKIENHPLSKQIQEDEAAKALTQRQEVAGKIEALQKHWLETGARLHGICNEKETSYLKAKAAYEIASSEFNQARAVVMAENSSFESQIRILQDTLFESSDPRIHEAIDFFRKKLDWLRSPGRLSRRAGGAERNIYNETVTVTAESNRVAILAALAYCQSSIKALEAMKLEPEIDLKRVEEMKAGIPSIDNYSESTGVKPMPGSKGVNPLQLLKSEDQQAWELGKIAEKFKKVMHRKVA
jgi:hypothetical protein